MCGGDRASANYTGEELLYARNVHELQWTTIAAISTSICLLIGLQLLINTAIPLTGIDAQSLYLIASRGGYNNNTRLSIKHLQAYGYWIPISGAICRAVVALIIYQLFKQLKISTPYVDAGVFSESFFEVPTLNALDIPKSTC